MVTLALVRHAKSDWADPSLDDHDRPLNARGLRDAPRMAERLAASGFLPEVIVSSTALRARTTAEAFGTRFDVPVDLEPELYGAAPRVLLARAAATGADSVLLVAHDPGMSVLAGRLSGAITHMPTCAVATFTWPESDWADAVAAEPESWTFDAPRESG